MKLKQLRIVYDILRILFIASIIFFVVILFIYSSANTGDPLMTKIFKSLSELYPILFSIIGVFSIQLFYFRYRIKKEERGNK